MMRSDLFLEDWVVSQDVVGVKIPQPVGEDHGEGESEEDMWRVRI